MIGYRLLMGLLEKLMGCRYTDTGCQYIRASTEISSTDPIPIANELRKMREQCPSVDGVMIDILYGFDNIHPKTLGQVNITVAYRGDGEVIEQHLADLGYTIH